VLGRDPYYGVRHIRADTGEPYVIDPNSSGNFRTIRKPGKQSDDKAQEPHIWEYDPALVTIYETDSEETKSILDAIYQGKANRHNFKVRFRRLPCKTELLRHLVYSWCGLLGLRYTRNGQSPDNQELDILQNWSKDFSVQTEDLKIFLRNNSWPLPVNIFAEEPDNTQNKIGLPDREYKRRFRNEVELLPQLEERLREIKAIQPESMEADEKKQQKIQDLSKEIEVLARSRTTPNKSVPEMTQREKGKLVTQIRNDNWRQESEQMLEENPGMFKTDIAKKICRRENKLRKQKGEKQLDWKTISRQI
jgi:hypothetical protein